MPKPTKTQPSRHRRRNSIVRSVLVRLDKEQDHRIREQELALGESAASILRRSWDRLEPGELSYTGRKGVVLVLPAAADAAMLVALRQLGSLLGHGVREGRLPHDTALRTLDGIRDLVRGYSVALEEVTKKAAKQHEVGT